MCAHYTIQNTKLVVVAAKYGVTVPKTASEGNVSQHFYPSRGATTTLVPAVRCVEGKRGLHLLRWDLVPLWWHHPLAEKKFSSFNARSDSLTEKASYKHTWKYRRRCILPATSFFEWPERDSVPRGAKRTEREIRIAGEDVFAIAGIWEECVLPDDVIIHSCAMITTDANAVMAAIPHSRMPVILPSGVVDEWLDPDTSAEEAFRLLAPYPAQEMQVL